MALITFFALIFTAVPTLNAYAAEPHTGSYTGTGSAYTGATVSFDIDDNGVMSNFNTTSYCFDGLYSQPVTWVGMPATTVQPGVPFEVNWEYNTGDVSPYYELTGTVNADGSANGTGRAGFLPYGTCGGFEFSWSAERVGGGEPEPVYDPTLLITPETISLADLADTGVQFIGGGFPANVPVTYTLDGEEIGIAESVTKAVLNSPTPRRRSPQEHTRLSSTLMRKEPRFRERSPLKMILNPYTNPRWESALPNSPFLNSQTPVYRLPLRESRQTLPSSSS